MWDKSQAQLDSGHTHSPGSSAPIDPSHILSGSIAGNNYLQSANYVENTSGWKLFGNGNLEANDGFFRGDISAATGGFDSIEIGTSPNWFRTNEDGDSWWGAVTLATANAYIQNDGEAKFKKITLESNVVISGLQAGSALAIEFLSAGIITSKSIVLAAGGGGDVEIRSGISAGDFINAGANSGFIFGADSSDGNKPKLYFGTPANFIKYDPDNGVVLNVPINIDLSFTAGEDISIREAVSVYQTPQEGLVSYWSLEETSGNDRVDSKGSNNLTDSTTVANATGIAGNAANFELDNSEYLEIADGSQTGLDQAGDMSISLWVKFENLPSFNVGMTFVSKYNGTTDNGSYLFQLANNVGTLQLEYQNKGTPDGNSAGTTKAQVDWIPSTGVWYHLIVVYDASAGEVSFYIDKSQQGSTQGGMNTIQTDTSAAFRIGSLENNSAFMDGLIDEVAFYSQKLTTVQIETLFNPNPYTATSKVVLATAVYTDSTKKFAGLATETISKGNTIIIRSDGKSTGHSSLDVETHTYYLSNTRGAISTTAGDVTKIIGRTISDTDLQVKYQLT